MTIDKILTGKFTGPPIFILLMLSVFHLTFNVAGKFLSDLLAAVIDSGISILSYFLLNTGVNPLFHALVIDGVCAGVGSVLSFIPIIAVLFFLLTFLEETGYFPKVAVMMDKPMSKIGLSGRCIIPLIMGFGCSVPAILATGTMLSPKYRAKTILLIPFMSCSAKLPVYAMLTAVFFEKGRVWAMAAIYAGGVAIAVLYALVIKHAGIFADFPGCSSKGAVCRHHCAAAHAAGYKLPDMRIVFAAVWDSIKGFIKKAFTVIFMASVIIWFLQSFDSGLHPVTNCSDSLLAALGKWAAPVFTPLGFGDWRAASAVIAGLSAKEAVVSTFAVLAATAPDNCLSTLLSDIFSPLSAFSFMIFCLLYIPCIASLAAVRNQTGSWRQSILMMVSQTVIAWMAAFGVYQVGMIVLQ